MSLLGTKQNQLRKKGGKLSVVVNVVIKNECNREMVGNQFFIV